MAKRRDKRCCLCGARVQKIRFYTAGHLAGHEVCYKCGKAIDRDPSYFDYLHDHCVDNGGVLCKETVLSPAAHAAGKMQI